MDFCGCQRRVTAILELEFQVGVTPDMGAGTQTPLSEKAMQAHTH